MSTWSEKGGFLISMDQTPIKVYFHYDWYPHKSGLNSVIC